MPPPNVGDYVWAPGSITLHHEEGIGPHHRRHDNGPYYLPDGDAVRYHVTWLRTAKKRVLELPKIFLDQCVADGTATAEANRREAELDDHGESYPAAWQGPDLYIYLHIPAGAYMLSLYFFNKDGHDGWNRNRDYVVSAIPLPPSYYFGTALQPNTASLAKMRGTTQSRVVAFCGGVWRRFLVRGPMKLAVRVAKNYSLNTILQAAMLDPLSQHPAPYYYGYRAWLAHEKQRREVRTKLAARWRSGQIPWHRHPADDPTGNPSTKSANNRDVAMAADIMQALNLLEHRDPVAWAANQQLAYTVLLRWCVANYGAISKSPTSAAIAEQCYYHLCLFHHWEATEESRGILTSRQIEKALRSNGWPYSYRGHEFGVIRRYLRKLKFRSMSPHSRSWRKDIPQ